MTKLNFLSFTVHTSCWCEGCCFPLAEGALTPPEAPPQIEFIAVSAFELASPPTAAATSSAADAPDSTCTLFPISSLPSSSSSDDSMSSTLTLIPS